MRGRHLYLAIAVTSVALIVTTHFLLTRKERHPKPRDLSDVVQEPVRGQNNIFVVETSCVLTPNLDRNTGLLLSKRQACTVESAAKANPEATVYVLHTCSVNGGIRTSAEHVKQLFSYPNVKTWEVQAEEFLRDTPLQDWDFLGALSASKFPVEHGSEVLRYAALWKYGGTYIDHDMIVRRSLKELGHNYVGQENLDWLSACVLSFSPDDIGRNLSGTLLYELMVEFRGDAWSYNGADLVTSLIAHVCRTEEIRHMTPRKCHGIKVLSMDHFTPVRFPEWHILYRTTDTSTTMHRVRKSFGVHTWNSVSKSHVIDISKNHPYRLLAKTFCPHTFKLF